MKMITSKLVIAAAVGAVAVGIGGWSYRHQIANRLRGETPTVCEEMAVAEVKVFSVTPTDAQANAPLDQPVRAEIVTEGLTLDPSTVSPATVALFRVRDRKLVDAKLSVEEGGKVIVLTPAKPLEPQTNYQFVMTNGIKETNGGTVAPVQTAFNTVPASPLDLPKFEKVELKETAGLGVTFVQVGPDGRLWCTVDDGRILRFDIADDGTLSNKQECKSLSNSLGKPRLIGGLAFDPASMPENPIVWVTHTSFGFINMADWAGAVSRMSGPNLEKVEPIVVHLPRSARDHVIHQPVFGPDGCLYFQSGSMSSFGDPDGYWGWRAEHPFSAAIVKLDPKKLPAKLPIDVKTTAGGNYNWQSADAPLTVYANGVRVAYDICWTKSGQLFAAVNGSSAGGNTPAGPNSPKIWGVPDPEHDWLFRIEEGRYYGHPNPSQNGYVLNGGNPTPGPDFSEVPQYPVGTQPEANWHPPVFDFGGHVSANGTFQYQGDGPLDGALVVCRYNVGSDLIAIKMDDKGEVAGVISGVPGWNEFDSPLDACQDVKRGNVYVSEYGKHVVTLLRKK